MRNEFPIIREHKKDNTLYLYVDTKKAILRGMKWDQLGEWGKRKIENMLFLTVINKEYVKIRYI